MLADLGSEQSSRDIAYSLAEKGAQFLKKLGELSCTIFSGLEENLSSLRRELQYLIKTN